MVVLKSPDPKECQAGNPELRSASRKDYSSKEVATMRWFHTIVIVALIAVTLIFAIQNLQSVTVSFVNLKVSSPLAVLIALVYVLGMFTGGSAWALIKWAIDESRKP